MSGRQSARPRLAVVLQPRDRLDPRGVPTTSVAIVALALAEALADRFEVAVVVPACGPLPAQTPAGLRLLPVPVPDMRREKLLQAAEVLLPPEMPRFARADFHRRFYEQAALALVAFAPHIVHLHGWVQGLLVLRERLRCTSFVLHLHDPHPALLPRHCLGPTMALADRIVVVSAFLRRRLAAAFPELAPLLVTVPNGADLKLWRRCAGPAPAGARILLAGRISPEKGHHVLVEAFARILGHIPEASLEFVGRPGMFSWAYVRLLADDPPMRSALRFWGRGPLDRLWRQLVAPSRAYLSDLRSMLPRAGRDRLRIRPPVPHDALPEVFAAARIVAVPSVIEEPFGLPAVEAMAAGRPVVGSDRGGIAECVRHGESGLLVPAGDAQALAEALLELLRDPERCAAMGARGRELAAAFDWQRSAARLLEVYAGLLGDRSLAAPAEEDRA